MFCPKCRSQLDISYEQCPNCGTDLSEVKKMLNNNQGGTLGESQLNETLVQPVEPQDVDKPVETPQLEVESLSTINAEPQVQPMMEPQPTVNIEPQMQQPAQSQQVVSEQLVVEPTSQVESTTSQSTEKTNKNYLIIGVIVVVIIGIIAIVITNNKTKENNGSTIPSINSNKTSDKKTKPDNTNTTNTSTTDDMYLDKEGNFAMTIDSVFTISGRGTVVTGRVERGTVKQGDTVQIIGMDMDTRTAKIGEMSQFNEDIGTVSAGEEVGLTLEGVERNEVEVGQVVIAPNTMRAYTEFEATVNLYSTANGGRSTAVFTGYKPDIHIRGVDIKGTFDVPDYVEMIQPGDSKVTVKIRLAQSVGLETGTDFTIKEDGKTIGDGVASILIK